MEIPSNQGDFDRLLQLKFRLKRLAHFKPLSLNENQSLEEIEELLRKCTNSHQYLVNFSQNENYLTG
jgi:hypothetical protein